MRMFFAILALACMCHTPTLTELAVILLAVGSLFK
jgi:hypothetical protein